MVGIGRVSPMPVTVRAYEPQGHIPARTMCPPPRALRMTRTRTPIATKSQT